MPKTLISSELSNEAFSTLMDESLLTEKLFDFKGRINKEVLN